MLMGLPGSGKSTYAASLVKEGWVEVNKDQIRADLAKTGWVWSHEREGDVVAERNKQITFALMAGNDVVSSDTNFGRKHKVALEGIARTCKAEFEIRRFDVPLETCLERNRGRQGEVPDQVIKDMYHKYVVSDAINWPNSVTQPQVEKVMRDYSLPLAILCDLDGTLALHVGNRSPYDTAKCGEDVINEPIRGLINLYDDRDIAQIIYMTGRDEEFREITETWLYDKGCPDGSMFMRPKGDKRKDWIVKLELFNQHIRGKFDVEFVLDDRDQVVKMWRSLGLTCLQCADGAF
jgi:predicted kinase